MTQYSLQETTDYLKDMATEELQHFIPFVVTDPHNLIRIEDYVEYPFYEIDLAQTKAGDLEKHIVEIRRQNKPIVIFKNVDKISSRKDKKTWQYMIVKAMKGESSTMIFDDRELPLPPFGKIKAIGTCSVFPEYLRNRHLGTGPDFSEYINYNQSNNKKTMGLWSEGIKRSKEGVGAEQEQETKPTTKEIDWEERHFQVCLALLSRTDMSNTVPGIIIKRADKMIEELKKRAESAE